MVKPGKYKAVVCCGYLNMRKTVNIIRVPLLVRVDILYGHLKLVACTHGPNKIYFVITPNSTLNITVYDYS